ncbi:MAG: hypothetical protein AAFO82_06110, partial [Bacteroidota bacterium]
MKKIGSKLQIKGRRTKSLFFCLLITIGLLLSILAERLDYYNYNTIYDSVISNIAAGFFLSAVMYFLMTFFSIDESESKLNNLEKAVIDVQKTQDTELLKLTQLENQIRRLEFSEGTMSYFSEKDFYKHYFDLLDKAEVSIKLITEGFPCHNDYSKRLSKKFTAHLQSAMDRGVNISLFQYSTYLNIEWFKKLIELRSSYQNNFQVHFNKALDPRSHPSTFVIIDSEQSYPSTCLILTKDKSANNGL